MVHCSASRPAVSAVYWIMETLQCPLPPPAEAASVYFQSIEMWEAWPKLHPMNVNNCCKWPATMQPPLQHSPQPLQRCSTVCRQCEDMKHNQYVCTMHWLWTLCTHYAYAQFPQTLPHCRPGGGHLRWNKTINTSQQSAPTISRAKWYA